MKPRARFVVRGGAGFISAEEDEAAWNNVKAFDSGSNFQADRLDAERDMYEERRVSAQTCEAVTGAKAAVEIIFRDERKLAGHRATVMDGAPAVQEDETAVLGFLVHHSDSDSGEFNAVIAAADIDSGVQRRPDISAPRLPTPWAHGRTVPTTSTSGPGAPHPALPGVRRGFPAPGDS
jgi:hypothetical protein